MSLPYYALYPSDFDADEKIRLMEDDEIGFFMRCLNHAWSNDGLPANPDEIRRALRYSPEEFSRKWQRVGECFPVAEDGRRRNTRQEKERISAKKKTAGGKKGASARWGNASASESAMRSHCEGNARAYGSGYSSDSGVEVKEKTPSAKNPPSPVESEPRTLVIVSRRETDPEEIVRVTCELYAAGGLPVPLGVQTMAEMAMARIEPPERRLRLPRYVAFCFQSGRWNSPAKTKSLKNLLAEGMDWDVDVTPRVIPKARDPDKGKTLEDSARDALARAARLEARGLGQEKRT